MLRKGLYVFWSVCLFVLCSFLLMACGEKGNVEENNATPTPAIDASELTETPALTATPTLTPAPTDIPDDELVLDESLKITFSLEETFYKESVELEFSGSEEGRIFYSTDGSVPSSDNREYKNAIKISASSYLKVNTYSVCLITPDGRKSPTYVKTYFVGTTVGERYDTLIFCITTDPYNLYNYETGIFVEGKVRDDYIAENPREVINAGSPANFNVRGIESERDIYLEVYNSDGTTILMQNAGVRTFGGWSRANAQKPLKLFARKEYDEVNNKFRYEFFDDSYDVNGNVNDTFKRLVLRAAGNDNGFAFIRDELFQTLAKAAGYKDTKSIRPCAVYINGSYYGQYWLTEVLHSSYFEAHYGKGEGEFVLLEGGETYKTPDEENDYAIEDYEEFYNKYATADLTDDNIFNELCTYMDVQNYIEYYAYNIMIGNEDWPGNNYKLYRYYAGENEEYGEAPFDGKWRYLLHDMDFSTGIYGRSYKELFISSYISDNGDINDTCPMFCNLMKRKDCVEIYIRKSLELINGVFADDYFSNVLDELNASRSNELYYTYFSGKLASWVSADQLSGRISEIKKYMSSRIDYAYDRMFSFFWLQGEKYTLNVEQSDGSSVCINTFTTDEDFTGRYYSCYDITLTAVPKEGQSFSCWMVNGVQVTDEILVIDESLINDGIVDVKLVTGQ